MLLIDVATLNATSTSLYTILFILLGIFWFQNRDIEAAFWWALFPAFRIFNLLISSDTRDYVMNLPIYIGNFFVLLSGVFLLIGCMKFVKMKINYVLIYAFVAVFIAVFAIQFAVNVEFETRATTLSLASIILVTFSMVAITKLENEYYVFEKRFLLFWLGVQFLIFSFWLFYGFHFPEGNIAAMGVNSLGLLNLSHVFITVGLVIMALAKRSEQLEAENDRYKLVSKSLNEALGASQEANEEKSVFLKSMSHELRTPLNAIMGYAETVQMDKFGTLNEKQQEYIGHIKTGGDYLLKLIKDLLDVSNIEIGAVDVDIEKQDPAKLLGKTRPLLDELIRKNQNDLSIENDFKNNDCPDVYVDPVRFKQVMINIVSNASNYSPEKSKITIRLFRKNDDYVRISVTDQGLGVSADQAENIFKPYHRGGYENSTIDGVGIGLAVSKTMIEAMKGDIGFDSKMGKGATFWFDIPIAHEGEEQ
ncbi:sensor histidine kinase [Pseudemcibacter aquimaris]|uniref:sensor histidine kinase n=1 Tax=Pseudemcibacter aquimaris TaxID=2857064 RepID=UPI0020113ACB|nr:ATP-binding protein [Pseudemcibacter aquimaris]MCC3859822.1 hypothetical protein [Pseudemcibacter aquimaris]WDU60216.1 hypothetical protein KW060_08085 [Pseudemcibacter aquimaris]